MMRSNFLKLVLSLLLGFFLLSNFLQAQSLKKLKEIKVGQIESVAIDRLGNFFLVQKTGEIRKYDSNGKILASLKKGNVPTLLEPWFHPKIFVYDRHGQQVLTYDRSLQNPDIQQLDPSIAIKPLLACPTSDNKLLVLDGADFSIKKVNPLNNEVTAEFYIDTTATKSNYVCMREYQNLIFLLDKNSGVVIYNVVGKKVNQLKTDANNFGFFGEELYFLQEGKIVFYDLYTEKIRLVDVGVGKFVLVSDEQEKEGLKLILLVKENGRAILYEFNEKTSGN